jgi:hypothetical protein
MVEHAIVHRNSHCVRSFARSRYSFAIIITIDTRLHATLIAFDWLVREHHRDWHTCLQKLVGIKSRYSLANMVVIARALTVQRDVRCGQSNSLSCCVATDSMIVAPRSRTWVSSSTLVQLAFHDITSTNNLASPVSSFS